MNSTKTKPEIKINPVKDWDKVYCARCGAVISMLSADTINHGEAFICKGGDCHGPRRNSH